MGGGGGVWVGGGGVFRRFFRLFLTFPRLFKTSFSAILGVFFGYF